MLDLLQRKPISDITARITQQCHADHVITQSMRGCTWEYPVGTGQLLTLDELCAKSTCTKSTIVQRLKRGWDVTKAIETPPCVTSDHIRRGAKRTFIVGQRLLTANQIEKEFGINADTYSYRIKHGWTTEEALGLKPYETNRKSLDTRPTQTRTWEYLGQSHTLRSLMQYTTIAKGTLLSRLNAGWDIEEALTQPARCKGV